MKRLLTIIICLGIFLFLLLIFVLPDNNVDKINEVLKQYPGIDKTAHFAEHIVVFFLFYYVIGLVCKKHSRKFRIAIVIGCSLSISIFDEFHQRLVMGRSFEYEDLLANTSGLLMGLTLVNLKHMKIWKIVTIIVVLLSFSSFLTYSSYDKMKYFYRGIEYQKNGEYKKSKEQLFLALEAGNKSAGLYNEIAWLESEFLKEDLQAACEYAQKAILLDPNNPDYLDTYGWTLFCLNKPEDAIVYFKKAFELDPQIFCIHYHLGITYYALGKLEESLHHLRKQIDFNTEDRYASLSKETIKNINQGMDRDIRSE